MSSKTPSFICKMLNKVATGSYLLAATPPSIRMENTRDYLKTVRFVLLQCVSFQLLEPTQATTSSVLQKDLEPTQATTSSVLQKDLD
jgi:hypothetical protein